MSVSIYIHWPFCISKCPYCSFNSYVKEVPYGFIEKYLYEIRQYKDYLAKNNVSSIYFGGGTPSLMPVNYINLILEEIRKIAKFDEKAEITIECNPGTIYYDRLQEYKSLGINRPSIGVQSLNDNNLKFLGRKHSSRDNLEIIGFVEKLFNNYSLDFIYTLPNQQLSDWMIELDEIIKLSAPHLSLYQLTIEENTPFYNSGYCIDEKISSDFFDYTSSTLVKNNYDWYEISNFCLNDMQSIHNMQYWNYEDFIGIGPGASGRITLSGKKYEIYYDKSIEEWGDKKAHVTELTNYEIEEEALIMGLRTKYGVDIKKISKTYFNNLDKIKFFIENKLLTINNNYLQTTIEGRIKSEGIIKEILLS